MVRGVLQVVVMIGLVAIVSQCHGQQTADEDQLISEIFDTSPNTIPVVPSGQKDAPNPATAAPNEPVAPNAVAAAPSVPATPNAAAAAPTVPVAPNAAAAAPSASVDTPRVGDEEGNPCGTMGECVPFYLCANGSIITTGETILDERFLLDARNGAEDDPNPEQHPCKDFFETCCLLRSKEGMKIHKKVKNPEGCGYRNDNGVAFELKPRDNEAQFAEFPWATALLHKKEMFDVTVTVYQCGGALIHPSVVVTAAHCVKQKKPQEFVVRAGEWDTQRVTEPFPHVDRGVSEILMHEDFRPGSLFNDIALLFLESPIELAPNINTACLPAADTTYDHQRCIANGWGKDKFEKGTYQAIMKRVELPIIPHDKCQKTLRTTRLGRFFILDDSFVCAGGELGMDTCTGDGGAPLVCPIVGTDNQYHQVGIVSWGINCGGDAPGVYVNVAKYRKWIDTAFQTRNLETKYYIP